MFWCKLAQAIGRPICEVKDTVPFSEILLWRAYFNTEHERHEKIEWYLAQVAMEINRSMSSKKRSWKIRDYLIKFRKSQSAPASSQEAQEWGMTWLRNLAGVPKKRIKKGKRNDT